MQNVVPQPDGDSSKVKVKVRVNVHGIFTVSGATLIEKQKGEGGGEEVHMDTEPLAQNDGRAEDQVMTRRNTAAPVFTSCRLSLHRGVTTLNTLSLSLNQLSLA